MEKILPSKPEIPVKHAFTVVGELTDLNTYIDAERSHRLIASKLKREETERVAWEAKGARLPKIAEYPVHLAYRWYSKDTRKDIDNVAFAKKFVHDGLVLAGVLEGDSRKHVAGFSDSFFVDKENPRVEVEITRDLTT
jgi:Holliday junction resolvase RusA-like endonuclease